MLWCNWEFKAVGLLAVSRKLICRYDASRFVSLRHVGNYMENYVDIHIEIYLMWLDFSALNMSKEELSKFLQEKAKVALDDGFWFGENGIGFERINIACPRYMLEIGLHRIKEAVNNI